MNHAAATSKARQSFVHYGNNIRSYSFLGEKRRKRNRRASLIIYYCERRETRKKHTTRFQTFLLWSFSFSFFILLLSIIRIYITLPRGCLSFPAMVPASQRDLLAELLWNSAFNNLGAFPIQIAIVQRIFYAYIYRITDTGHLLWFRLYRLATQLPYQANGHLV